LAPATEYDGALGQGARRNVEIQWHFVRVHAFRKSVALPGKDLGFCARTEIKEARFAADVSDSFAITVRCFDEEQLSAASIKNS
jgi:hypothetical protein